MSLLITRKGACDTIQDGGRKGFRHLGIGPAGPMDAFSAGLANVLLGNEESSALLELHFPAASIRFIHPTVLCISGGNFSPQVNGFPVALHQPHYVPANSLLEFKKVVSGRWCYVAIARGLKTDQWLGSSSSHTKAGGSGYTGRTLKTGDAIAYNNDLHFSVPNTDQVQPLRWSVPYSLPGDTGQLQFTIGNEWNWLNTDEASWFQTATYTVSAQSDRMGYRLIGPMLRACKQVQLLSSPVAFGTIQLLPDGSLIVLMADHQTTGGYPRIGHVTAADIGKLAQKGAHEPFSFVLTHPSTARKMNTEQRAYLHGLKISCTFKMTNLLHATV